jgi:sigma-B regulation protein RsbU (phosphoserine phosphatase)
VGLAALFSALMLLYSVLWMYAVRRHQAAALGAEYDYHRARAVVKLRALTHAGGAERAGLAVGDEIRAIDGRPLLTLMPLAEAIYHRAPGDRVRLTVQRPGAGAARQVEVVLGPWRPDRQPFSRRLVEELLGAYPVLFVLVAVGVLVSRVDDAHAWRLALLFAAFIASAPLQEVQTPPALLGFASAYHVFFYGLSPALFLCFFSVFPEPSPLERRLPWLKRAWLAAGLTVVAPFAVAALATGTTGPLEAWLIGTRLPARWPTIVYYFAGFGLGFLSLVWNAFASGSAARRKSRMIVAGTLGGFLPIFLLFAAAVYSNRDPYEFPFWLWASCVLAMALIPLSFAYAVVRHRVLELPVLLRSSVRYLLVQRGSLGMLLLLGVAATVSFALGFGRYFGPESEALAIGLGAGFGTVLVLTGTEVQRRVSERIDRAFFRHAYDVRQVLQELAERARTATSREELAELLDQQVASALRPSTLRLYVERGQGVLRLARGTAPPGWETLPGTLPVLSELARRGQPLEVDPAKPEGRAVLGTLAPLAPDCLVPVLGRGGSLIGLLALGARLSESPYSGEDRSLLASVASQAGIALESIGLAEQMAKRLEAERLAQREMELAKQVQGKLLPQAPPSMASIECAGCCVQARAVGGDYYDFLDLGAGRIGLVLADVSGKGFPAALLMASLQASLRSRLVLGLHELPRTLAAANELLYRSSETNRFATLFLGIYDEAAGTLRYANCGHNPPVVLRRDGSLERLAPTAPVVGLFDDWQCSTSEIRLASGDLLVLFSDGITEAFDDAGQEFGEARLVELLRAHRQRRAGDLVDAVLAEVRRFSGTTQEDDQTLVVARVR